jgi:chromosome segregation ATPase
MSDSETLNLLRSIDGRLGNVETRLGGIETGLSGVETRLGGFETRLGGIETGLSGVETRLGGFETLLSGVETRLSGVETRLGGFETLLSGVETRLSGVGTSMETLEKRMETLETRLETLETVTARAPDLRLLGHQMATMVERITKLEASNTRAIAALNDVVRDSVTPGEVEALHTELNEFRNAKFNHEVRIRQLEAELNIAPSS